MQKEKINNPNIVMGEDNIRGSPVAPLPSGSREISAIGSSNLSSIPSPGSPTNHQAGISPATDAKRAGLKVMLRRQIEKVNTRRRTVGGPRSPQGRAAMNGPPAIPPVVNNESDDEFPSVNNQQQATKYERLERAVKRQLSRGRQARRKLLELRGKIEMRKRFEKRQRNFVDENGGYLSETGPVSPQSGNKRGLPLPAQVESTKKGGIFRRRLRSKVKSEALLLVDDEEEEDEDLLVTEDEEEEEEELMADALVDLDEEEIAWRKQLIKNRIDAASKLSWISIAALIAATASATVTTMVAIQSPSSWSNIQLILSVLVLILLIDTVRRSVLGLTGSMVAVASGGGNYLYTEDHHTTSGAVKTGKIYAPTKSNEDKKKHAGTKRLSNSNRPRGVSATTESALLASRRKGHLRRNTRSLSPRMRWPHWQVPQVSTRTPAANSWAKVPASHFYLRGPNYLTGDRNKVQSEPALYEPLAIHIFETRGMVNVLEAYPELLAQMKALAPICSDDALPRILCLTLNVPKEAPSMRGFFPNSPCFTVVCLFGTSESVRKQADSMLQSDKEIKLTNGYRLFRNWINCADRDIIFNSRLKGAFFCRPASNTKEDDDNEQQRNEIIDDDDLDMNESQTEAAQPNSVKNEIELPGSPQKKQINEEILPETPVKMSHSVGPVSPNATNADALLSGDDEKSQQQQSGRGGVPRILQKWNGKPVLMAENATGFSRHRKGISKLTRGDDYVEVCINIGDSFSYMGRGAVYVMLSKLPSLAVDCCFCIEGRAPDELPEAVLGCLTFSSLNLYEVFKNISSSGIVGINQSTFPSTKVSTENSSSATAASHPPPAPAAPQQPSSPPPPPF